MNAVVANLKQPVADLVYTLWITGWRRREIQFLRWEDVNMEAGEIRLTAGRSKTRAARVFPFAASRSLAAIVRSRALTRAQVPQSVAMRLLGHKTAIMFLRYDVAATEDLAEAVAAVEEPKKPTKP